MRALIGQSTATHFLLPKIGDNQVQKVLRLAGNKIINKTKHFSESLIQAA